VRRNAGDCSADTGTGGVGGPGATGVAAGGSGGDAGVDAGAAAFCARADDAAASTRVPIDNAANVGRMARRSRPPLAAITTTIRYCAVSVTVSITVSPEIDVDDDLRPYAVSVSVVGVAVRNE
jgi:hypothetical protein